MSKTKTPTIKEDQILKALKELEDQVEKGNVPKEMKNANGGLATEGKDLEDEVSASEGEGVKKAGDEESKSKLTLKGGKPKSKAMPADESSSEASSEEEGSEESSDDESMGKGEATSSPYDPEHETTSPEKKRGAVKKGDDESSEGVAKSFRERAEDDDTLAKGIEVSGFMENLVDILSDSDAMLRKSVLGAHKEQTEFNGKLRKALVAMGHELVEQRDIMKSLVERLENNPSIPQRKSVLSKSELNERTFNRNGGEESRINSSNHGRVVEMLMSKAMKGEIPTSIVTQFELGHELPGDLAKSIENELSKSDS